MDILWGIELGTKVFKQGKSDLCGGKDEGGETKIVQACEKEMHSCKNSPVRSCEGLVVVGLRRGRDGPKKYWGVVIGQGMTCLSTTYQEMTLDRKMWRSKIRIQD